jgi:hypothetical protein
MRNLPRFPRSKIIPSTRSLGGYVAMMMVVVAFVMTMMLIGVFQTVEHTLEKVNSLVDFNGHFSGGPLPKFEEDESTKARWVGNSRM